jgi:hypothetical protein
VDRPPLHDLIPNDNQPIRPFTGSIKKYQNFRSTGDLGVPTAEVIPSPCRPRAAIAISATYIRSVESFAKAGITLPPRKQRLNLMVTRFAQAKHHCIYTDSHARSVGSSSTRLCSTESKQFTRSAINQRHHLMHTIAANVKWRRVIGDASALIIVLFNDLQHPTAAASLNADSS